MILPEHRTSEVGNLLEPFAKVGSRRPLFRKVTCLDTSDCPSTLHVLGLHISAWKANPMHPFRLGGGVGHQNVGPEYH